MNIFDTEDERIARSVEYFLFSNGHDTATETYTLANVPDLCRLVMQMLQQERKANVKGLRAINPYWNASCASNAENELEQYIQDCEVQAGMREQRDFTNF